MIYLQVFWIWVSNFCGALFQESYSRGWDKTLNKLMEDREPVAMVDQHTVKIGSYEVWVSNRWYSYAHPYNCGKPKVRPSIKTMIRFSCYVEENSWSS